MKIICDILNWIYQDLEHGEDSTIGFIGALGFCLLVLVALAAPAVSAARKAGNEAQARHARGEYTTWAEERQQKCEMVRARTEWYKTQTGEPR